MRKLVLEKPGVLSVVETDPPRVDVGETRVIVEVAGLGGSEYLGLRNPGIRKLPNAMAHGITGLSEADHRVAVYPLTSCGNCAWCRKGQLQLCEQWQMIGVHRDGGFCQQLSIKDQCLVPIPDSLSWEQSSFIEPFANSVNAVELSNATSDSTIAVLGVGGLGLGVVAACTGLGCSLVSVIDPSGPRIQAAVSLGAVQDDALNASTFDIVFDTVGTVESTKQALTLTNNTGTCVLLGFGEPQLDIDRGSFIRSQKRMIGSFAYSKEQFIRAVTLAEKSRSDWVTNLTFDEVLGQLQNFVAGNFETIKAVLRPNS